jgi:hypothetical protein
MHPPFMFGFFKQEVVGALRNLIFQLYKLWGGSYNNRLGWTIGEFISFEWHAWISPQTTNWYLLCVHYTKLDVQMYVVDMDICALHLK